MCPVVSARFFRGGERRRSGGIIAVFEANARTTLHTTLSRAASAFQAVRRLARGRRGEVPHAVGMPGLRQGRRSVEDEPPGSAWPAHELDMRVVWPEFEPVCRDDEHATAREQIGVVNERLESRGEMATNPVGVLHPCVDGQGPPRLPGRPLLRRRPSPIATRPQSVCPRVIRRRSNKLEVLRHRSACVVRFACWRGQAYTKCPARLPAAVGSTIPGDAASGYPQAPHANRPGSAWPFRYRSPILCSTFVLTAPDDRRIRMEGASGVGGDASLCGRSPHTSIPRR